MYTYTMTFVSGEVLGLPGASESADALISEIITDRFSKRELELADFNWSGNYSSDDSLSYLGAPYMCNVVVEVRMELDLRTIQSRQAIYDRCLDAVQLHQVHLKSVRCIKDQPVGRKCVLCFDVAA